MKRFLGFTLSELMIAITVLGVLCATVLPAVLGNNPNQNKMMIKKAYYTATEIVNELINNQSLYPDKSAACATSTTDPDCYVGFDDMSAVSYEGNTKLVDNCEYSSQHKFPCLFTSQLNIEEDIDPGIKEDENGNIVINGYGMKFKTTDGIEWNFRGINGDFTHTEIDDVFKQGNIDSYKWIYMDINGDKKPNCRQSDTKADEKCKARTKNFDQFRIKVYADGRTEIDSDDIWATEAVQVSSSLSEDD